MRKRKRRLRERQRKRDHGCDDKRRRSDNAERGCEREHSEPGGDEAGGGGGGRQGCVRPGTQSSGRGDV